MLVSIFDDFNFCKRALAAAIRYHEYQIHSQYNFHIRKCGPENVISQNFILQLSLSLSVHFVTVVLED